jgi:hypothetical protein
MQEEAPNNRVVLLIAWGVHGEFHFVPFTSTYVERAKHGQADIGGGCDRQMM